MEELRQKKEQHLCAQFLYFFNVHCKRSYHVLHTSSTPSLYALKDGKQIIKGING
jgi:hypothetical protein